MRIFALAAVVVGLLAAAPADGLAAPGGATTFVHSANSGEIRGDRLTLRGVGHTVTWTTNGGHSGVVSIALMHRRLFAPGTPAATGTLHVAGKRPGSEQALALSRPRYSRSRQAVSYRVKRLDTGGGASGVGSAAQNSQPAAAFGAASLSIVGAPPVLGSTFGGNDCSTSLGNSTFNDLQAIGSSKWDTDSWYQGIPPNYVLNFDGHLSWESDGGLFRGCSNSAVWQVVPDPRSDASGTIALTTTYPWDGNPTYTCTPSNPVVHCTQAGGGAPAGQVAWLVSQD